VPENSSRSDFRPRSCVVHREDGRGEDGHQGRRSRRRRVRYRAPTKVVGARENAVAVAGVLRFIEATLPEASEPKREAVAESLGQGAPLAQCANAL
jgi:hypothetical protein